MTGRVAIRPAPAPADLPDMIAAEIAATVADHIEAMYPAAAEAVAWRSARRSIAGVIRNAVAAAGRAAEAGRGEQWVRDGRARRRAARHGARRADAMAAAIIGKGASDAV
jgi:hypothetical protein